jgi:hypothetical protein
VYLLENARSATLTGPDPWGGENRNPADIGQLLRNDADGGDGPPQTHCALPTTQPAWSCAGEHDSIAAWFAVAARLLPTG